LLIADAPSGATSLAPQADKGASIGEGLGLTGGSPFTVIITSIFSQYYTLRILNNQIHEIKILVVGKRDKKMF
jgi:hypothetical protein